MMRSPRPSSGTRRGPSRAFTLVEVTATVTVLGLLSAAAVGTYSAVVGDRQLAAVESVLRDVVLAQKQLAADHGTYTTWSDDLGAVAASAVLLPDAEVTREGRVSMSVGADGTLGLAAQTEAGDCVVWRVASLGAGGGQVVVEDAASCSGAAGLPAGEEPAVQGSAVRSS